MMERKTLIDSFFIRAKQDPRLSKAHLALFLVLCYLYNEGGPIVAFSREIMPLAKISSSATYHILIRQLAEYGYLRYEPSHDKYRASQIDLETAWKE